MKIMPLPNVDYADLSPAEALVKFYTDLGWDPKNELLEPKRVRIPKMDYHILGEKLHSLEPGLKKEINLMLLNEGPSCRYPDVKQGTVRLYKGWVQNI